MQPTYLPWIGYFKLMSIVDIFVFLDDIQFDKRSWQQRNKISSKMLDFYLLTMPVVSKGLFNQKLNEVKIVDSENSIKKHLDIIYHEYSKSPFFVQNFEEIEYIYQQNDSDLCKLNIKFIEYFKKKLNINTKTILSSQLEINSKKETKLFEICKVINTSTYISPIGSLNYLRNTDIFCKNQINVKMFNYEPKIYKNFRNKNCSHLSFLDVLFNFGNSSKKVMNEGKLLLKPLTEF